MPSLVRFGVSLERDLLADFDRRITKRGYANRSKAIADLIRDALVEVEWKAPGRLVSGVISLVYDHHKRQLADILTGIQHDHGHMIISSQHIHLDHDNCLEVIIVRGRSDDVARLAEALRATKGVKHGGFIMTTTGRQI